LHLILDDFSPDKGDAVCAWAEAKNVEPADAVLRLVAEPHRAQFKALRYFCLNGTDHPDHATQARLIRRYVHWRNRHIYDPRLRHIIRRANTANVA
jgi:hypothetical protein